MDSPLLQKVSSIENKNKKELKLVKENSNLLRQIPINLNPENYLIRYNINGMKEKILFFILFISFVSASTVSIGTCAKFNLDGKQCQQCISSYHLFGGLCFVDIPNCLEYSEGFSCKKCLTETSVLINNQCCDRQCLKKLFETKSNPSEQYSIQKNLQNIFKMLEYVENSYLRSNFGRLVKIDVKEYNQIERWFLLYEFQNQNTSYQRIILDFKLISANFIPIDFSSLTNPNDFNSIAWKVVEDSSSVLIQFATLYSNTSNYLESRVKQAILSEVSQYQVFTLTLEKLELREIYTYQNTSIILNELIYHYTSSPKASNGTSSQNHINTSTMNTSTLNTSTLYSQFSSYQLSYEGMEIAAEMDVNDGLSAAVELAMNSSSWNHTLKKVIERGKSLDSTQFTVIGVNEATAIRFVMNYNILAANTSIVSISSSIINGTSTPAQNVGDNTTITSNTTSSNNGTGKTKVSKEGCITHTSYTAPFSPDIQKMAQKLSKIKDNYFLSLLQNSSTPIIADSSLIMRRIVVSQFCQDFSYKEIAYVQGDSVSTKEYFTYYLEQDINTVKNWYFLGNNSKIQPTTVYSDPTAYALNLVDPSFVMYPSATLYSQRGTITNYMNNLTYDDRTTFASLSVDMTSERDRNLGKITRFSIAGYDPTQAMYKATGWVILSQPQGLITSGFTISQLCAEAMVTESLIIGSNGPQQQKPYTFNGVNYLRNEV